MLTVKDKVEIAIKNLQFEKQIPSIFYRTLWPNGNPMLPAFRAQKCIFIHVPKAAGSSVSHALFGKAVGHRPIRRHVAYSPDLIKEFYKFTFVRNPWDRLHSGYHYFYRCVGMNAHRDHRWANQFLSQLNTFEKFIHELENPKFVNIIKKYDHFRDQRDWLYDPKSGKNLIDFVGRFENLDNDFKTICNYLGIERRLPHERKGNGGDFRKYYTKKMISIAASVYENDIREFSYKFD